MNILKDKWIPFNDNLITVAEALSQPLFGKTDIYSSVEMSRFIKVFLHGVIQTVYCPKSKAEWNCLYNSEPTTNEVAKRINDFKFIDLFELSSMNSKFMQFSEILSESESTKTVEVKSLFFDGCKSEASSFTKSEPNVSRWFAVNRGDNRGVCDSCSGFFLWFYQITAYKAGQGHYGAVSGDKSGFAIFEAKPESDISFWKECVLNVIPYSESAKKSDFSWNYLKCRTLDKERTEKSKTDSNVYKEESAKLPMEDINSPIFPYFFAPRKVLLPKINDSEMRGECACGVCGKIATDNITHLHMAPYGFQLGEVRVVPPYSIKNFYIDKKTDELVKSLLSLKHSDTFLFKMSSDVLSIMKSKLSPMESAYNIRSCAFDMDFIDEHEIDLDIKMSIFGLDASAADLTMFVDNDVSFWRCNEYELECLNKLAKWTSKVMFFGVKAACLSSSDSSIGRKGEAYFSNLKKGAGRFSISVIESMFILPNGKISVSNESLIDFSKIVTSYIDSECKKYIDKNCERFPMDSGKAYLYLAKNMSASKKSICSEVLGICHNK